MSTYSGKATLLITFGCAVVIALHPLIIYYLTSSNKGKLDNQEVASKFDSVYSGLKTSKPAALAYPIV